MRCQDMCGDEPVVEFVRCERCNAALIDKTVITMIVKGQLEIFDMTTNMQYQHNEIGASVVGVGKHRRVQLTIHGQSLRRAKPPKLLQAGNSA